MMAGFDPRQQDIDAFDSRFGPGRAADRRGSFSQYLAQDSSSGDYAAGMQSTFKPPVTTNQQEEQAYGDRNEAVNMAQFGENLGRVTSQQGQYASLGFNAVNSAQSIKQAKEMASMQAASANSAANMSMISSGMGMLGSIGSFAKSFSGPTTSIHASTFQYPTGFR
jgi:hypothetical protein